MRQTFWILTWMLMPLAAMALKPVGRSPLATEPTYCDQQSVWRQDGNRVIDTRDGRVQSVSMLNEGPYSGTPEQAARAFLSEHTDLMQFVPTAENLAAVRTVETPMGYHVTFEYNVNGVPVYPGNCVVTLDRQGSVKFFFSSLMPVSESTPTQVTLSAEDAINIAHRYLKPKTAPQDKAQTELVVWAGDNRDFAVCWKVWQFVSDPLGDWEVLVDANSGQIRRVADRLCYENGTGLVFRPDPLTTAEVNYGDNGYTDGSDASTPQLFAQEFVDSLRDITLSAGVYHLQGPWVYDDDWDPPTSPINTATNPDSFRFDRLAQGFEDVMVYYNIDTSQRWIQFLGFNNIQHAPIHVDPHGVNGQDNSYFVPSSNRIAYGEGGVDDAEDADVIWHEYGHAIQSSSVPGWGGGDEGGMGEGFGDYWAGSFSYSISTYHDTWVFNWDGHNPFWSGRVLNANYHYPEDNGEVHDAGMIWSQPCFETMEDIGREVMDRIVLQHHFLLGTNASMPTAAEAILTVDQNLYGGEHQAVIYQHFVPRGLLTMPPVLAVTSPNGGELWPIDSTVTVSWSIGSVSGNISIELSRNGIAGPWEVLAASTPNDGAQTIVVSGDPTDHARVRITSLSVPDSTDMSDADFFIAPLQVVLGTDVEDGAPGWTHESGGGSWVDQWHISTERANSPTHSYKNGDTGTGNYANLCDARLTSPVIDNLPENATLSFYHQIQSEISGAYPDSAYDGGVIELSEDGGTFQLVTPRTGYPKVFRTQSGGGNPYSGPMPGVPCYAGTITSWTRQEVDLSPWAGHSVQVRFRFGSDAGTTNEGWYVDDILIYAPQGITTPQDVTIYRIGDDINLRWASDGNPYYKVYSSTSPEGPFDTLEGSTDQTVFVVPGGLSAATKFFVVVGWDGN
jgi:Zn-dependent metalloprotease